MATQQGGVLRRIERWQIQISKGLLNSDNQTQMEMSAKGNSGKC